MFVICNQGTVPIQYMLLLLMLQKLNMRLLELVYLDPELFLEANVKLQHTRQLLIFSYFS